MDLITAMVPIYISLINKGAMTVAQVPQSYQEAVKTKLESKA